MPSLIAHAFEALKTAFSSQPAPTNSASTGPGADEIIISDSPPVTTVTADIDKKTGTMKAAAGATEGPTPDTKSKSSESSDVTAAVTPVESDKLPIDSDHDEDSFTTVTFLNGESITLSPRPLTVFHAYQ